MSPNATVVVVCVFLLVVFCFVWLVLAWLVLVFGFVWLVWFSCLFVCFFYLGTRAVFLLQNDRISLEAINWL